MTRNVWFGGAAALLSASIAMVLNENDFDQVPPTDTADVFATFAALGGATLWFVLRGASTKSLAVQALRAVAAGIAMGALVAGLVSVVYDPWAP